jgi:outer membrane protein
MDHSTILNQGGGMNRRMQAMMAPLALMVAAGAASAQSAGSWSVKLGVNKITPHVTSGDVSPPALPHTTADVGSDTEPVLVIGYTISDHLAAELDLGMPYKHDFIGAGAIQGAGTIGTAEALPPTAFIQYRFFEPTARLRPYAGTGLTYVYFQKETGSGQLTAIANTGGPATSFRLDNKLCASVQIGSTYALNQRWYADVAVVKTWLKTKVSYSTGQTQDIRFDPISVSVGLGYRF